MADYTISLNNRLTQAVEELGAAQPKPRTAQQYVDDIVKHVLRGQADAIAARESQAVLAAYDAAANEVQREVRRVLGIQEAFR